MKNDEMVPVLPFTREWMIALSIDDETLAAYDVETQELLFEGRYFAPKEFRSRDPRQWTPRMFEELRSKYGIFGGTRFDGAIFVLAEVALLMGLMHASTPIARKALQLVPLKDALTVARDTWAEAVQMHTDPDAA